MDNKITKQRLNNFLSYRWLMIVATVVAAIVIWEVLLTTTATKLQKGQYFEIYYDLNIDYSNAGAFVYMLGNTAFSYDVREVGSEQITEEKDFYSTVFLRLSSDEGSAVITDDTLTEENGINVSKVKEYVDVCNSDKCSIFDMDGLYLQAKEYLSYFLMDGETDPTVYANLDENKIADHFHKRKANDNDYKAGLIPVEKEYQRIAKLCQDLNDLKTIIEYDNGLNDEESIFYRYRKYEQIKETSADPTAKANYQTLYENEQVKKYGIRVDKLPSLGASRVPADYFRRTDKSSSENIVILVADMATYGDLKFEAVSFITTVVKTFSNIL